MHQRVCPTCGQPLAEGEFHEVELLEESGISGTHSSRRVLVAGSWLLVVLVLVALIVNAVEGTSDNRNDPLGVLGGSVGPERIEAAVTGLRVQIGGRRFAYMGDTELVIIDTRPGRNPSTTHEPQSVSIGDLPDGFADLTFLSEGTVTYGIEGDDDPKIYKMSNDGQVIAGDDHGFTVAGNPAEPRNDLYLGTVAESAVSHLVVPVGATQLNVAGFGVLVVMPDGGTYLARTDRFELFSEYPVITSTPTHHVEIRCDSSLECVPVLVDRDSAESVELPEEFAGAVGAGSISPDGRWVLLLNAETDELFDRATGEVTVIDGFEKGPVAWAADSSFALWFDPTDTQPLLRVLDPIEGRIEPSDLSELGAPQRSGLAVVVLP